MSVTKKNGESAKSEDVIRRYHKFGNCPVGEKVILVMDGRMDDEQVAELDKQPGGSAAVMVNEGAEIAHILAQVAPVATLDSLLITLIQLRPAGRLYGEQIPQGEEGDNEVTEQEEKPSQ